MVKIIVISNAINDEIRSLLFNCQILGYSLLSYFNNKNITSLSNISNHYFN